MGIRTDLIKHYLVSAVAAAVAGAAVTIFKAPIPPATSAFIGGFAVGVAFEWWQKRSGSGTFDPLDIAADAAGAFTVALGMYLGGAT